MSHRESSASTALEFARTTMPGDMIEHGIDQSGFVVVDEGVGDIHIFRNNHAGWNIIAVGQLIGSGAEHRAQDRVDSLERPVLGENLVDEGIETALIANDPGNNIAKECRFPRQKLRAFDLTTDPVAFKLGDDVVEPGRGAPP